MRTITFNQPKTKLCPFCGESIQARAVKCRYCAEFLNTDEAKALESEPRNKPPTADGRSDILFTARPSLWALAPAVIRGSLFLGLAVFLIYFPLELLPSLKFNEQITTGQLQLLREYRLIGGIGLAVLVTLIIFIKVLNLKMIYYEVTADRIEWSRGIFDRRVDNLDMFRIIDLKLRRSLLDCIVGIGTIGLITTDKTDPEFNFRKVKNPRRLYNLIKTAALDADRKNSVIHLE